MIKVTNVSKSYGKKRALKNVSLCLEKGSVVALLGENGAGKTTLLRILSGLLSHKEGTVLIDEKRPNVCGDKISYITGEGSYFAAFKVGEYGEFLQDVHASFDIERYAKLCNFFSLEANDKISKLSTGQKARVELAAGFAKKADYIFMDEPFLGKDVFTRRDFLKLMSGALHGDEVIVLCTHYIEEIENFVDRVIIMHEGEIARDKQIDEIHANGNTLIDEMAQVVGYDANKHIVLD